MVVVMAPVAEVSSVPWCQWLLPFPLVRPKSLLPSKHTLLELIHTLHFLSERIPRKEVQYDKVLYEKGSLLLQSYVLNVSWNILGFIIYTF